jgi:cytochrome c peroxidase
VSAGYSPWLFRDGHKGSLWAQALGPLAVAVEHGGNRTRYAHLLASNYRMEYEAVFGLMPRLDGLPQDAGPDAVAASPMFSMSSHFMPPRGATV